MKLFYILIFIVFGSQLFGQTNLSKDSYELSWSKAYKDARESEYRFILGDNNDQILALSPNRKNIIINLFDSNNVLLQTSTLFNKIKTKENSELISFTQINNEFWAFYTILSNKNKTEQLFTQRFDVDEMTLLEDPILLSSIGFKKAVFNSNRFEIIFSRDNSKILICADKTAYSQSMNRIISSDSMNLELICFSGSFDKLWTNELLLPYNRKFFHFYDFILDNEGNFHLLGEKYTKGTVRRDKGKSNYYFNLWSIFDKGMRLVKNEISLNDQFISDLKFELDSDNNLIGLGFYSDNTSYTAKGLYYLKYEKETGRELKDTLINFSNHLLEKNQFRTSNKKENSQLNELYNFSIHHLLIDSNNYLKIIAEQDFKKKYASQKTAYLNNWDPTRLKRSNNGTFSQENLDNSRTNFINNNIIILKLHPNGDVIWSETIGKRQVAHSEENQFTSYVLHQNKDDLYFVYNDNIKNYNPEKEYFLNFSFGKNGIVTMTKLDNFGAQSKTPLYFVKDHKLLIKPSYCHSLPNNKLILISHENKTYKLGQMIIKN